MTKPITSADTVAATPAKTVQAVPSATVPSATVHAGTVHAGTAPNRPWPGQLVQLDRGEVFVRSTPAEPGAELAVYVHGLGGSALNWTDLMGLLSQPAAGNGSGPAFAGLPLLAGDALDLPGFGFSPPPADRDYSLNARVAAVIELIEQRASRPVHLVGNSLGGAVSTRVAARRPDLVKSLTLISPAMPDLRPRLLPMRLALVSVPGIGRFLLNKMLAMSAGQRADRSIGELFANPALLHPQRRDEAIAEIIRRDGLDYALDALLASGRALVSEYTRPGLGSLWHDAARVSAPTLVIHGSHDRLVNPGTAGRAARTYPNCRVVVLPKVGHVAMMERPDLVEHEMREFLHRATAAQDGRAALSRAAG